MRRRDVLGFSLALVSWAGDSRRSRAQSKYLERPIRLVIPFPPGGAFDVIGRPWADKMKSLLGTVVVENMAGGGGSLGAATVARARPDGYTLLVGGSSTHVAEAILKSRPLYNPVRDLEPVSNIALSAFALAIPPKVPARNLEEFVAHAKADPGKLSYGHGGTGSLAHLTGELLKVSSGIDIVAVPYRGAAPALADTVSGQVSMVIAVVTGSVLELHRTGKLRILAVTSPGRLAAAADIPTAIEAGVPGMISQQWIGLFAPTGTPQEIIAQLSAATCAALADEAYQRALVEAGFVAETDSTPDRLRELIKQDLDRWTPLVSTMGLKID